MIIIFLSNILLSFGITGLIALFVYSKRNDAVFKETIHILQIVSDLSKEDIKNNRDYKWRYEEMDSISYQDMLLPFWKPVKSFYKNKNCIKKIEEIIKEEL